MKIDLHESDMNKLTDHFARIHLAYMPLGVWVAIDDFHKAPLQSLTIKFIATKTGSDQLINPAGLVYVRLEKADFSLPINLPDGSRESIHVIRWNVPLTHAMVRIAMSSQGLTFNGGVIVDLHRAGGMADDMWWLNIYVMLSRARKLENIILIGLTPQLKELLEAGPPAYIRVQIKALQK